MAWVSISLCPCVLVEPREVVYAHDGHKCSAAFGYAPMYCTQQRSAVTTKMNPRSRSRCSARTSVDVLHAHELRRYPICFCFVVHSHWQPKVQSITRLMGPYYSGNVAGFTVLSSYAPWAICEPKGWPLTIAFQGGILCLKPLSHFWL